MPDFVIRRLLVAALTTLCLVSSVPVRAERIHRYTDEDGVVVLSNVGPGKQRRGLTVRERGEVVRITAPAAAFKARSIPEEYDAWVEEACALYRIPAALVRAVMAAESNFNPQVVSHAGAMGLMQLMPGTAAEMFVEDAFEPRQNIFGGVRYLRVLANLFNGDMTRMVAAYNAGPNAVTRAGGIPAIAETQEYVRRVLRLYFSYKTEAGAGSSTSGSPSDERGSNDG